MIKLDNLTKQSQAEAYILNIGDLKLLILGKPDYSSLSYFRPSGTHQTKTYKQNHLNCPYKLNLQFLKQTDLTTISLILICNYKALLLVPYIMRIKQIPILLTQPMIQLGKLFCLYLLQHIHNQDRFCEVTDFMTQSQTFDIFQQQHNINLQDFSNLYSTHELTSMFLNSKKINPGQNYHYGQLILTPYHTGSSIGQCMWNIKLKLTGNDILVILNGSSQNWRHCQQIQSSRLFNRITDLVVGKNIISSNIDMPLEISQFIATVQRKLRSHQNVHLHFENNFDLLDTIEIINYHIQGVFKQIVVLDSTFISFVKLTNSSIENLSTKRANKIFNDPPQYPYSDIDGLLDKGILSAGGLVEIANKQKVPVKQVLLRFKPGVYMYMKELQHIGSCGEKTDIIPPNYGFRLSQFKKWIDTINPKRIFSYSNEVGNLILQKQINLKLENYKTFQYKDSIHILKQYQLLNGSIISEAEKQYRVVPKDWSLKISSVLKMSNITSQTSIKTLTTQCSKLSLIDYTFHLTSSNPKQAEKIVKILTSL